MEGTGPLRRRVSGALTAAAGAAGVLLAVLDRLWHGRRAADFFWLGSCLIPDGGVIGLAVLAAAVLLLLPLRRPGAARPAEGAAWLILAAAYLPRPLILLEQIRYLHTAWTTPEHITAAHRTGGIASAALAALFLLLAVCTLRKRPVPSAAVCALLGIGLPIPTEALLHMACDDAPKHLMAVTAVLHILLIGALWARYGSRRALPDALLWGALAALVLRTVVPESGEFPLPSPFSDSQIAQATAWLTAAGILTVLIGRYCAGRRAGHAVRAAGYGVTAAGILAYAVGALSVLPTIEGTVRTAGLCCLAAACIGQAVCAAIGRPMRGVCRIVPCALSVTAVLAWAGTASDRAQAFSSALRLALNDISASLAVPLILLAAGIACTDGEDK